MIRPLLIFCSVLLLITACKKEDPLIMSANTKADISRMLEIQKKLTSHSQVPVWNIFSQPMTINEKDALEFLYAYMPLSDLADYTPEFFLANIKQSLKAREDFSWCKTEPEEIFLHFVLPLRVNNENLDSFRLKMYDEIKARVKGMPMAEAALEINHWCHEKVTYHATDTRTSAPLSTIRKSFGRCGEESTFTVAAMRTAGIPARQVYTPRWAHVDDNHAWVEVWIDGKWNYMGACEPEPELNQGWFTEPSSRVMLVHTRVYGRYTFDNEAITDADRFTEINLTARYAPVKSLIVIVKDKEGQPVRNARIEFGLYNYAEFYPIAAKYTDKAGGAQLSTGLGDLLIWASKNGLFDYRMISAAITDTIALVLNKSDLPAHTELYDLNPPHARKINNQPTQEQKMENTRRIVQEDSIRRIYEVTFKDHRWSDSLAAKTGLNRDTVMAVFDKAYGNWPEIASYLERNAAAYKSTVLALLMQLSDKDFSDARESVLTGHLRQTTLPVDTNRAVFEKYVLSPRIADENLSDWRGFLREKMEAITGPLKDDLSPLTGWIQKNIVLDDEANLHSRTAISPIGVFNLRVADRISRDVFFVASCRSLGIPARINPVTHMTEYYDRNKWFEANLDNSSDLQPAKGFLRLTESVNPFMPQYYIHFTLAKLSDGHFVTLEFEEGRKLSDFPGSMPMDTGKYLLVTGNRLEDGSVLNSLTFFKIEKDKQIRVPVFIRLIPNLKPPTGKLDLDVLMLSVPGQVNPHKLSALAGGKKLIILVVDPDQEPSRHVLDELAAYTDHFNKWEGRFLLAMPRNKSTVVSVLKPYDLPNENAQGIDVNNNISKALEKLYNQDLSDKLPLVVLCDQDGLVYLFSAGYKIGLGEQLLKLTR
jgi:transglutaminase-like putative cysteine protease